MQTRKEPCFQFSVPLRQSQAIDGKNVKYVVAPYGSLTYTKNDRGKLLPKAQTQNGHARLVENWGSPVEMMDSDCPLCRLFAFHACDYQFVNGPMQGRSYDLCQLSVKVKHCRPLNRKRVTSVANFWYLDPTAGSPRSSSNGHGILCPVLIDPSTVDYSSIRTWLSDCRGNHAEECNLQPSEILPSLQLIDCLAFPPEVVQAQPQHRFVALSYVWGVGGVGSQFSGDSLIWRLLPRTIRDAIVVTTQLGFRYLWVDRYCIPKARTQEQIGKMDIIYAGAELVIVAAAGDTIEYGLPGIGERKRIQQQPYARIGKDLFASTLGDFNSIGLHAMPWSTRAWCFQEALLSRRRLVFTDDKVYFFCRQMLCIETLSLPFHNPQDRPLTSRVNASTDFYKWLTTRRLPSGNPEQIYDILTEYSTKDMTYESDGLNAIVGVLRAFSNSDGKVEFNSYAGLPLLGRPTRKAFLSALLWSTHTPKKRRSGGLPSWSWVGWTGSFRRDRGLRSVDDDIRVRLVKQDGCILSWKDFVKSGLLKGNPFPLSRYIELLVQTTFVHIEYVATSRIQGGGGYVIPLQHFDGGKARYAKISLDFAQTSSPKLGDESHATIVNSPTKCMMLIPPDNHQKLYGVGILLRPVGGVFERFGTVGFAYNGDVWDADGNYDSLLVDTDPKATIEGLDLKREWIRLG
ncbi:hypothetical protein G647_06433 [Cladophialophora carrionii CBS 160.54]|uniref:Heterokaryon incompatibility domain-containing protein n=1 Tax=Cladophialophora carrionii CBS 160.54 TaxID=1279043 RepID=V9D650_9EURO|nr:uncharacterized protein G647_06433 [Cladophialophora carrionii CBS 160.54]ETI22359.1 hypothetical protein G647_06433 [Cladophialophora carrionii CBS 160.54]